jgi:hypothetical protein
MQVSRNQGLVLLRAWLYDDTAAVCAGPPAGRAQLIDSPRTCWCNVVTAVGGVFFFLRSLDLHGRWNSEALGFDQMALQK